MIVFRAGVYYRLYDQGNPERQGVDIPTKPNGAKYSVNVGLAPLSQTPCGYRASGLRLFFCLHNGA